MYEDVVNIFVYFKIEISTDIFTHKMFQPLLNDNF